MKKVILTASVFHYSIEVNIFGEYKVIDHKKETIMMGFISDSKGKIGALTTIRYGGLISKELGGKIEKFLCFTYAAHKEMNQISL